MLKIFAEQMSLFVMLFLFVVGLAVYYDRTKARKNETSQQQLANDLYAVISLFFGFALLTFGMMSFNGNIANTNNFIEIETLIDAQHYFRMQDEELKQIRSNYNNFIGLTKTFVVVSATTLMLIYKILKTYQQNLGKQ